MNERIGWNITMQQIHIFLQAMERRNFSKAATALNFTPSMVSKTILAMEAELGVTLFLRENHSLTPTPAANVLADEWRLLIGSYDRTIHKVRALQNQRAETVVLGFVDSSARIDGFIKRTIREYGARRPDICLTAEKHDMHRSVELLKLGMLDLAITNEMELPFLREHELRWDTLAETDVVAYVPRDNPLYNRDSLSFSDLREQPLVALDAKMHPQYNRWLFTLCTSHGFAPRTEVYFRTVRSLMFSLDLQSYIFIGDSITMDWCSDALKAFVLPAKSSAIIAYRKDSPQPVLDYKRFLCNLSYLIQRPCIA